MGSTASGGTLAIGIFGQKALGLPAEGLCYGGGFGQLGIQSLGAGTVAVFSIVCMGAVFLAIKYTMGLRVPRAEEFRGLDIGQHGMESYAGFQIFANE